tara:strand:+ start:6118 stop:7044 length:927 start_codon:yes stop_codon:yes gene_type:complete
MKAIKILLLLFIFFYPKNIVYALENKILIKVDNEIITSADIYNESNYLTALNKEIKELKENEIFKIAKNSLVREKIKEIEIKKNNLQFEVEDEYLNELIKSNYSKIGINNLNELLNLTNSLKINSELIIRKLSTNILWNNLIFSKYSSKIKIDKEKLKKEILTNKKYSNSYNLSEILFNISERSNFNIKHKEIIKAIEETNFKNAALIYSVSDSSSLGGELGWISENSINKKIKVELLNLKIGEYTKPILTPSGFLILFINDIKQIENNIDIERELTKLISLKTNQQFNQFSNLYFNKVKKNIVINEY